MIIIIVKQILSQVDTKSRRTPHTHTQYMLYFLQTLYTRPSTETTCNGRTLGAIIITRFNLFRNEEMQDATRKR